jgi:cell division transport system ATP-binding protein
MIEFRRVAKRYPSGQDALVEATFSIARGEFVYLTGHSGAGKSTVFRLAAAIERPSAGRVEVGGQDVGALPARAIPFLRRRIGLVLQDQRLLYDRSVFDNVMLPLEVVGLDRRDARRRVLAALDKVALRERERALPVSLSGGEQQRLCIARAIVNRPSLLLADEPTAYLDAAYAREILTLFQAFNAVGSTVVLATHDQSLVHAFPGRRIHLERGRVGAAADE